MKFDKQTQLDKFMVQLKMIKIEMNYIISTKKFNELFDKYEDLNNKINKLKLS